MNNMNSYVSHHSFEGAHKRKCLLQCSTSLRTTLPVVKESHVCSKRKNFQKELSFTFFYLSLPYLSYLTFLSLPYLSLPYLLPSFTFLYLTFYLLLPFFTLPFFTFFYLLLPSFTLLSFTFFYLSKRTFFFFLKKELSKRTFFYHRACSKRKFF